MPQFTFTWLLLVITWTAGAAQAPKFRHFQVEDGLPSATVYQAFQDSRDFLWLSTEAGLSRFDGSKFRNFSMDDGLPDNEIFGLFEDSQHRLWFRAYNGHLGYLWHDTIFSTHQIPWLRHLEKPHWVVQIFESSNHHLYFAQHRDGLTILKPNNKVLRVNQEDFKTAYIGQTVDNQAVPTMMVLACFETADKKVHVLTSHAAFRLEGANLVLEQKFQPHFTEIISISKSLAVGKSYENSDLYLLDYQSDSPFFPKKILSQRDFKSDSEILLLKADPKQDGFWVGSLGSGIFLVENPASKPVVMPLYLPEESVSSFLKDKEGNFWITTLGNGVFMLPDNKVLTYTLQDGLSENDLYALVVDKKGRVSVGTRHGKVHEIRPNRPIQTYSTNLLSLDYNRINCLEMDSKGNRWTGTDRGLTVLETGQHFHLTTIKSLAIDGQDVVFVGAGEDLYKIEKGKNPIKIWKNRTNAILPTAGGAWLGANTGLYFYDGKSVEKVKGSLLFNYRITDLERLSDGTLCIGTAGNGVLLKKGDRVQQVTKKNGLASNVCADLFTTANGMVWVASNGGVSKFHLKNGEPQDVFSYTEREYLASNDVRSVAVVGDTLWATTSAGLSYIEGANRATPAETLAPPTLYILSVKIRERDTTLRLQYDLDFYDNNIRIEYTGISFKSGAQVRYRYQMKGLTSAWLETSSSEVSFPALSPGSYVFTVKAVSIDGKESPAKSIFFMIQPPWWKRPIFVIPTVFIVLTLLLGGGFYVLKNREDKIKLKRQIMESERMALRAQMNPHFIFNALNSIQHFITMEDEISANYYLSQFAKLIRRVLENSKDSFISLEDEITTLRLYLELESLRFEGKFRYKIEIADDLDTYEMVFPTMIVQPFLENAIWHGLMPLKEREPLLLLNFSESNGFIICLIRDNGIGRKAAAANQPSRSERHRSTGISNTIRRLALLSKMEKKEAIVTITDLADEMGISLGTEVKIVVPIMNHETSDKT